MRGKIKFIADIAESVHERGTFQEFQEWVVKLDAFQFDIETDINDEKWIFNKLISMQFGSCDFKNRTQWFIQWSELTDEQKAWMLDFLNTSKVLKLAHNMKFEYVIMRMHGVIIENIYDTMIGEKVINAGLETFEYSLADISWKYLRIIMNKEEQTAFGDNIITDSKILYGCTDVMYLDIIKRQQIETASKFEQGLSQNLLNVMGLEMDVLPAFGDMIYEGVRLDIEKWRDNIHLAEPVIQSTFDKVDAWLHKDPFKAKAEALGYISNLDRVTWNFKSWQQKDELLKLIFPDILGGSKAVVQKYVRTNAMTMGTDNLDMLTKYLNQDYEDLAERLKNDYREEMVMRGYIIPAGQSTINWNSPDQVLSLALLVEPRLKGMSEEEIAKTTHPMLKDMQEYKEALKLVSTYGEEFIRKNVLHDGRVHGNYNQLMSTGRVSMSDPNVQQTPVTELVGNRYRNAYVPDPGETFVGSDYISQELIMIAYVSKDPVWMRSIELGEDLHSVCAELLYKKKWLEAASPDCEYYKMVVGPDGQLKQNRQKCSCKKHKPLRYDVKSINFMLAYGGGAYKLAGTLEIDLKAAERLIAEYFKTFPSIATTLGFLGEFGVRHGYIMTLAPFFRRRYFPYWREYSSYADIHIQGIKYIPTLGEIERASKNHPIQGGAADITKAALVLIRNYIRDNNLWHKIKLRLQVHDEIVTSHVKDGTEHIWAKKMDELMCEAGRIVIPSGILKADTQIMECWTK